MPTLPQLPALSTIAQSIQLSLSPVFVLAGIGALLNVLAGRLSRVVDRVRALEPLHAGSEGIGRERYVWELRLLDRRITVINRALTLAVLSAMLTCVLVALLFVGSLVRFRVGQPVAVCFVAAMVLLIASLGCFLAEVRLSLRAIHVRSELLK